MCISYYYHKAARMSNTTARECTQASTQHGLRIGPPSIPLVGTTSCAATQRGDGRRLRPSPCRSGGREGGELKYGREARGVRTRWDAGVPPPNLDTAGPRQPLRQPTQAPLRDRSQCHQRLGDPPQPRLAAAARELRPAHARALPVAPRRPCQLPRLHLPTWHGERHSFGLIIRLEERGTWIGRGRPCQTYYEYTLEPWCAPGGAPGR